MEEWAVKLPKLKKRQLSTKQQQLHNFAAGQKAETRAADFLLNNSYSILDTNVVYFRHEIDIVALDETLNELVFVEVKYRASPAYGSPATAVSPQKLQSLQIAASAYRRKHLLQIPFRFDIISITAKHIDHFVNVTWP